MQLIPILFLVFIVSAIVRGGSRSRGTGPDRSRGASIVAGLVFLGVWLAIVQSSAADQGTRVPWLAILVVWFVIVLVVVAAVGQARARRRDRDTSIQIPQPARPPATRRPPGWAAQPPRPQARSETVMPPRSSRPAPESTQPAPKPPVSRPQPPPPTPPTERVDREAEAHMGANRFRPAREQSASSFRSPAKRKTASDEMVERARRFIDDRRPQR